MKKLLDSFTILSKLLDALMKLVESHLILQESPTELGLVIDV